MKSRKIIRKTGIIFLAAASCMNAFCTYIFVKAFGRKKETSRTHKKKKNSAREQKMADSIEARKRWAEKTPL